MKRVKLNDFISVTKESNDEILMRLDTGNDNTTISFNIVEFNELINNLKIFLLEEKPRTYKESRF